MMAEQKRQILIVEDDQDLAEMLSAYFSVQDYSVATTGWGSDAVNLASDLLPDLVILDIYLPDIDGFEVVHRLHDSHKTRNLPIIFLTQRDQRVDRLHGLELGVVDYVTKPFDIQELRLRVRNILRRVESMSMENPVTGLPEGHQLAQMLEKVRNETKDYGLLIVALRGLDTFRELYGFVASDDVLRVASLTIHNAALEIGGADAFCGHLDDHTFVIRLRLDASDALDKRIRERLSGSMEYFYPGDNRGSHAVSDDRLRLHMIPIGAEDTGFASLEDLKTYVSHRLEHEESANPGEIP